MGRTRCIAPLDLSEQFAGRDDVPRIYASAGIHPHEAKPGYAGGARKTGSTAEHKNVIAVGEIGLDYFYDHSPREQQKQIFRAQMEIAARAKLPIIIHCRLRRIPPTRGTTRWTCWKTDWAPHSLGGVLHCFGGGRRTRSARRHARLHDQLRRQHHLSQGAKPARCCRGSSPSEISSSKLTRRFLRPCRTAASAMSRRGWRPWPRSWPRCAAIRRKKSAAITTENFYRFSN
jgi:hypothetical protein